ncbi:MAG: lipopolysaccharide biosynthesis protein [Bacteroidota bacterium]
MLFTSAQSPDPPDAEASSLSWAQRLRWRVRRFLVGPLGKSGLSMADQALVSAGRLLLSIVVARAAGADALGLYALAFTLLLLAEAFAETLVALPYTVYSQRLGATARRSYLGSALVQVGALGIGMAGLVAAGGAVAWFGVGEVGLGSVLFALAGMLPLRLLMDLGRRVAFAHHRVHTALLMDVLLMAVLLGGLGMLAATGTVTVWHVYVLYGAACLLPLWLAFRPRRRGRGSFGWRVDPKAARTDLGQNWRFGRWVAAGRLSVNGREFGIPWLLAAFAGTAAVGFMDAAMKVVGLIFPMITALANVLTPSIAAAYAEDGVGAVRRMVAQTALLMGLATGAVALALALGSEWVIAFFFGEEFSGQHAAVVVYAVATVVEAIGMPADAGLWAIERPNVGFYVNLVSLVAAFAVAGALIPSLGVLGAIWGIAAGKGVATAGQLACFWWLSR